MSAPAAALIEVPRGLKGVAAARTAIGDVRGREGFFHYREHDAIRLAESRRFEEVWYLLHRGGLPDVRELAAFAEELRGLRDVPGPLRALLPGVAGLGDAPLAGLRAAYAA